MSCELMLSIAWDIAHAWARGRRGHASSLKRLHIQAKYSSCRFSCVAKGLSSRSSHELLEVS